MRLGVRSLALLSGLRIRRCLELWCSSQKHLDLAMLWLWHRPVAAALLQPLSLGTSMCPRKEEKKKEEAVGAQVLSPLVLQELL